MAAKKWYVYENLNNPADRLVLADDQVVASVYTIIGGPFNTEAQAREALRGFSAAS